MPTYQYTAKDNTGKTVTGVMDAENERVAANALRGVGLWPMRIEATGRRAPMPPAGASMPAGSAPGAAPTAPAASAPLGATGTGGAQAGVPGPTGAPAAGAEYLGASAPPMASGPSQGGPSSSPGWQQEPPSLGASSGQAQAGHPGAAVTVAPGVASFDTGEAGGVPLKHLVVYFRQLAASVHSGMPLSRCLEIVGQESRGRLARISLAAAAAAQQGTPLSEVFARYPRTFSPLILAMLRAGERGGLLDVCLRRIADLLERQHELQQRIAQQTFYPKLIIGASVFIMLATRFIIRMVTAGQGSPYSSGFGSILLPAIGGLVGLAVVLKIATTLGKDTRALDSIKLAIPMVGRVTRRLATARFARAAAMLYRAGVPLAEVVESSADASGNKVFAEGIKRAIPNVQRGGRLSDGLAPLGIFPTMAMSMLRTGEETGNIDDMLDKVADYCEQESETALKQMVAVLQPACILFLAIIVGAEVIRFYTGYFAAVFKESGLE